MQKICLFIIVLVFCTGCQRYYISVCQDKVDRNFLASTQAKTPDPRQENPPEGERLIVEWQVPRDLLKEDPCLLLDVVYKDYTEESFSYPICHRMDYVVYNLLGNEYKEKKGILTYQAKVQTENGKTFYDWKHQLWTKLIILEQDQEQDTVDSDSCTESMSSSVCSQPMQGSVMETEGRAEEEGD